MAITLAESADLFFNLGEEFYQRVLMAYGRTAVDIYMEDPGTANHAERKAWATTFLNNPRGQGQLLKMATISHPTVESNGASCTDTQLLTVASQVILNLVG